VRASSISQVLLQISSFNCIATVVSLAPLPHKSHDIAVSAQKCNIYTRSRLLARVVRVRLFSCILSESVCLFALDGDNMWVEFTLSGCFLRRFWLFCEID
jgi:hypothetical protein